VKTWRDVYTCHVCVCVCKCIVWSIGPVVENKFSLPCIIDLLEGLLHDMICIDTCTDDFCRRFLFRYWLLVC